MYFSFPTAYLMGDLGDIVQTETPKVYGKFFIMGLFDETGL